MGEPRKRYLLEDYRLEPDKQLLSRGEQAIRLPKKPFQVLLYLIEHRDRYVSRAELLDTFWDGREVYDDALRKCVGAIRKALDDPSDNPRFVETRWGVGYRYIGPLEEQVVAEERAITEIEKTRGLRIVVEEEEIKDDAAIDEKAMDEKAAVNLLPAPALSLSSLLKRHPKITALAFIFLSVAIVATVIVSFYRRGAPPEQSSRAPIRSIAVLPLRNLTNDPADEYLSEGITESLITALSKIEGLKVISRSSVFTFKDKDVDSREAGRLLGVEAVLEGSVRRSNDQVRVDVRLVSIRNGEVLWAGDAYERSIGDILVIQDEITRNVMTGLRLRLSGEGEQRLARRYTDNVEAYEAYLKGRYFLNKRTPEGITKAIEYFQQAIEIDPTYALAYTGLAEGYDKAYWFLGGNRELVVKQKEAAIKALALDDSLAEAHLVRSAAYAGDWNWSDSMREIERAVEINPGSAEVHHNYAYALLHRGRWDEAVAEIKRARELDPLNVVMNVDVGEILLYARRYDEAIEALKQAIEMDPTRPNAHYDLALAYERKGMDKEAVEEYLKTDTLRGASYERIAALKKGYAASGLRGFWQKQLEMAREYSKRNYVAPFTMARFYARLGDEDQAFDWLEKAYRERSPDLFNLRVEPMLDPLRSDPRYTDLLRRVGLSGESQVAFMPSITVPQPYGH